MSDLSSQIDFIRLSESERIGTLLKRWAASKEEHNYLLTFVANSLEYSFIPTSRTVIYTWGRRTWILNICEWCSRFIGEDIIPIAALTSFGMSVVCNKSETDQPFHFSNYNAIARYSKTILGSQMKAIQQTKSIWPMFTSTCLLLLLECEFWMWCLNVTKWNWYKLEDTSTKNTRP